MGISKSWGLVMEVEVCRQKKQQGRRKKKRRMKMKMIEADGWLGLCEITLSPEGHTRQPYQVLR